MPPKLDIEQIKAILAASTLVTSWQVLVADEAAHRAVYRIRCQLLRPSYRLEIRLIQTAEEILYSYQLFTDKPLIRWDNAPHWSKPSDSSEMGPGSSVKDRCLLLCLCSQLPVPLGIFQS